ncbi:MAG TPA: hypothetical protein VJT70_02095 [Sphingomicrobium sp.]|nr:hypothetical protein [Sphingomicrobium sp.]
MRRAKIYILVATALLATAGASAAPPAPDASGSAAPPAQNCDAHRFETTIHLTGSDGQPRQSKVKMCGTEGQSEAEWIHTLQDAVKKTALSAQMPPAAKEQIIAAVNAEIERLTRPALALPGGTDIAKLPKPNAARTAETPLSRDYGSLPPLPTASTVAPPNLLGPGGAFGAPAPRLTLRCALAGDEDRPSACDSIDKDTVLVVRADEAFPRGVAMRFVRHGNQRAELDLPALKAGQTASLRLPPAVCTGVVRSKVEIQALGGSAPSGTPAGTIGEYDLRC